MMWGHKFTVGGVGIHRWTLGDVETHRWTVGDVETHRWSLGNVETHRWTVGDVETQRWWVGNVETHRWTVGNVETHRWTGPIRGSTRIPFPLCFYVNVLMHSDRATFWISFCKTNEKPSFSWWLDSHTYSHTHSHTHSHSHAHSHSHSHSHSHAQRRTLYLFLNLAPYIFTSKALRCKDFHQIAVPNIITFADRFCKENERLLADVRPCGDVAVC
jgi:hypothetical protein